MTYHPDPKDNVQWNYFMDGEDLVPCSECDLETYTGFLCLDGGEWLCSACGSKKIVVVKCDCEVDMINLHQAMFNVASKLPLTDKSIAIRLDRAYQIIKEGGYDIDDVGDSTYVIKKASTSLLSDNSHQYLVTKKECNCPDYETARAGLCKHRLAVLILEEMKNVD